MARAPKPPGRVADLLRQGTPSGIADSLPEGWRKRALDDMTGKYGTPTSGTGTGPPTEFERRKTPRPTPDRRQNVTASPGGRATPPPLTRVPGPAAPPQIKAPKVPVPPKPKPPGMPRTPGINRLPRY